MKAIHDACIKSDLNSSTTGSALSMASIRTLIQENTISVSNTMESKQKDSKFPLGLEDKPVSKRKAFNNLSSNHKCLILNMHSDGSSILSSVCETCLDILHTKTGPDVVNFLTCLLSNENFVLARAIVHNLGHAQVFSKISSKINNVSPFYVHLCSQRNVKGVN